MTRQNNTTMITGNSNNATNNNNNNNTGSFSDDDDSSTSSSTSINAGNNQRKVKKRGDMEQAIPNKKTEKTKKKTKSKSHKQNTSSSRSGGGGNGGRGVVVGSSGVGGSGSGTNSIQPTTPSTSRSRSTTQSMDPPGSSPFNVLVDDSDTDSTLSSDSEDDDDDEGEELFPDTFSFLMTARYPFDSCCGSNNNNNSSMNSTMKSKTSQNGGQGGNNNKRKKKYQDIDSDYLCLPFWIGSFVNLCQIFIYMVVIGNQFVNSEIPPNADRWLRLAQIFAVLITLYTQSDFIDGIFLFTERWRPFAAITTPFKFNLSAILRILIGNVGIAATFILVIYSTEVVDLLLNFTAMEFVATLDGSAFEVASKGFLGQTLAVKAHEILDFRYTPRKRSHDVSKTRVWAHTFHVCLVFVAFFIVVAMQSNRLLGVDNEVYVQFDDNEARELSGISGVYKGCRGFQTKHTGQIGYVHISFEECPTLTEDGRFPVNTFVYCWDLKGWIFTAASENDEHDGMASADPCHDDTYILRSVSEDAVASDSFDILTHSKANWLVRLTEWNNEALLKFVFIESVQEYFSPFQGCENGLQPSHNGPYFNLNKDSENKAEDGTGSAWEDAVDPTARYVLNRIPIDTGTASYYPIFGSDKNERQTYVDAFGLIYRPLYARETSFSGRYEVVFYDGLRWVWLILNPLAFAVHVKDEAKAFSSGEKSGSFPVFEDCHFGSEDCLWRTFVKHYHTDRSWIWDDSIGVPLTISDPMRLFSTSDTIVPTLELNWYEAVPITGEYLSIGETLPTIPLMSGFFGFQCQNPESIFCSKENGEEKLSIDIPLERVPSNNLLLAFYGESSQAHFSSLIKNEPIFASTTEELTSFITENALTEIRFPSTGKYHLQECVPKEATCVNLLYVLTSGTGTDSGDFTISYKNETDTNMDRYYYWYCKSFQYGPGCATGFPEAVTEDPCNFIDTKDYKIEGALDTLFAVKKTPLPTIAPTPAPSPMPISPSTPWPTPGSTSTATFETTTT